MAVYHYKGFKAGGKQVKGTQDAESQRAVNPAVCRPFGDQEVVMQVDLWWGWIDPIFRLWLRTNYPWISLLYCPGRCTPVGQPMDRGVFALLKGLLCAAEAHAQR